MDPLSVTSGIVGVMAFAFQMAKTASILKRAVEEVKSAPQKATELIERLAMLETACRLIGLHLERRETLSDHYSTASMDAISKALARCLVRVQNLEQVLSTLSPSDALTPVPPSKFDTISRLRLVLHKDKISSLVKEIDCVISLLQFVIQVDTWTMTTIPLQSPSLSNTRIQLTGESSKMEGASNTTLADYTSPESTMARNIQRATNQQSRTFQYLSYITWTITDDEIWRDGDGDDNSIANRKGSITFRLPFTSTQLKLHYDGGMGAPTYALNVTHVIEEHSELGRKVWALMRPWSDPGELHRLVSGRELSIYSVFRSWSRETNLFFMAVGYRWAGGCKYLLEHDYRHQFEEDETPAYMFGTISGALSQTCEVTEIVLSMRPEDMQEKDMKYLLQTGSHPGYFNRYLKVFLKSPGIDPSGFLSHAWTCIVSNIFHWPEPPDEDCSWIPALRYLIEQGADIHQPFNTCYASAYILFLGATDHPFEADDNAYLWLEMLKLCGVELSSYLRVEAALIEKFGIGGYVNARERVIISLGFEGLPMPSWRWEVITASNIVEVLDEFHNLGPEGMEHQLGIYPTGPSDSKCWKAHIDHESWARKCYPFLLAPINCIKGLYDRRLDGLWCRQTYSRAVELRDQRFARRQAKKWRKAHPGAQPPSKTIPGSWVD